MVQSPKDLVPKFFGKTAKSYEKIAFCMTFGKDNFWKKEIVKKIIMPNSILDLACGTGKLTRMIAKKFPESKITGLDISESYLEIAKKNNLANITYVCQDAEKMNLDNKFDCICSSYIPKYCEAKVLINNCVDCLKPEGIIILHDFVCPTNTFFKKLWHFYFVLLKFLGNFIPSWKYAFSELPKIIQKSEWVKQYSQELEQRGFEIEQQVLTLNSAIILYAKKNI